MKKLIAFAAGAALACLLLTGCGTSVTGVTLPATLEAEKGQVIELAAEYTYKNPEAKAEDKAKAANRVPISYTSSGPAVVVAEDGTITAAQGGTATVTAASADGKINASCTVTVTVPVERVDILAQLTLTLNGTKSAILGAKVLPADATDTALTYTSSNEAVATVAADGTVTAVGRGEATITATSANGKSAATKVAVTVQATALNLNKTKLTLTVGGSSTLKATLAPEDADPVTISWVSSDDTVATVDSTGKITAKSKGSATITATTADGLTAECVITVTASTTNTGAGTSASGVAGSSNGSQGGTGAPAPVPDPAPAPKPEPQHYHGNGSDAGTCPVCGLGYSPSVDLDPDAGNELGGFD